MLDTKDKLVFERELEMDLDKQRLQLAKEELRMEKLEMINRRKQAIAAGDELKRQVEEAEKRIKE